MLTLATKFVPELASFETAQAAGFQAAEFWLDARWLERNNEIVATARQFPFRYALHFPNGGKIGDDLLARCATLYQELKCTALIIHQPMFDRYSAALREIAPQVRQAIENHVLDVPGFEQWAEDSPGLTLDVEHLWSFTLHDAPLSTLLEHVDRLLTRHAHKLHHVHLPGYVPGGEEHHPIYESSEMATEVVNRLADCGFDNLVVSEADTSFQTLDMLKADVAWFEGWKRQYAARK